MASFSQSLSINDLEQRPAPQYTSTASNGLSPQSEFPPQLEDSEFVDFHYASHTSSHSTSKRRRGQVSEREIETYQQWRVDIKSI